MDRDERTLIGEAGRERERVWSVVLAGGEGERLRCFTEQWLGRHVPKQYCTFVGTRSMLQHTWDRAAPISVPEHTLTVVARAHQEMARAQLVGHPGVDVIAHPSNRNTAAGMLLPLTHVRRRDPDAMVVVFPSDYFVWPEARLVRAVRDAVAAAGQFVQTLQDIGKPAACGGPLQLDGAEPPFAMQGVAR